MAKLRSDGPYFWVTWLTRLLAGEDACEWSAWFRARHDGGSWDRVPSDFDQAGWQMAPHGNGQRDPGTLGTAGARGVHREAERLQPPGERRDPGRQAGPGGPEGRRRHDHRREDRKPGPAHVVQVMLYMYAVPTAIGSTGESSSTARWPTGTTWWTYRRRRWTRSSWNGCPGSSPGWGRTRRPGGSPAPGSAGSAPSRKPTARSGWRMRARSKERPLTSEGAGPALRPEQSRLSPGSDGPGTCRPHNDATPGDGTWTSWALLAMYPRPSDRDELVTDRTDGSPSWSIGRRT